MRFAKGHGTENDFIILNASDVTGELTPHRVAALCDRRAGLGADGLIRVIRAGELAAEGQDIPAGIDPQDWFMDYRNADGSVAEMCGNGARVFAHWLRAQSLVDSDEFTIGTRAGAKPIVVEECSASCARVTVEMGQPEVRGLSSARMNGRDFMGMAVDMGNPHLAIVVPGLSEDELAAWELHAPQIDPEFFPAGVNVEFLTPLDRGVVSMRVLERGVGETRSCGTGTVAAARAALADAAQGEGRITVRVPGGEVEVEIYGGGSRLTGPSRIVAIGETSL